jgi:hypothetical protein
MNPIVFQKRENLVDVRVAARHAGNDLASTLSMAYCLVMPNCKTNPNPDSRYEK